jgi:TonB family protein
LLPRINLLALIGVIACFSGNAETFRYAKIEATSDFELKLFDNNVLVRRKGANNWEQSREVNEVIQVELFDGSHAYLLTKVINPPKHKHTPDPEPPAQARNQQKEGTVAVHAVVDERGTLRSIRFYSSSGPEFTANTIKALRKWSFDPARLNGQPVAVFINIEVLFRLSAFSSRSTHHTVITKH